MKIVSYIIPICLVFWMFGCREAPARGTFRKEYRESKNRKDYKREKKVIEQRAQPVGVFELPAYKVSETSILLSRKRYTVSYNVKNKIPDWVAWQLYFEHSEGPYKRLGTYLEDYSVPTPRATDNDYRGSGWSHGHMCPAGDNKWDEDAMRESNLLTNICPQDGRLNSGLWNKIEQDCRKWAKKYGVIYIVCGPVLLNKEHETIGENKVVVPEAFFKVVLCMNPKPKAIGFVVRNNAGTKKRDQFINTIDEVERITGIDFFPALPDDIENEVESYSNINDWN